jgi:hypothetical protein
MTPFSFQCSAGATLAEHADPVTPCSPPAADPAAAAAAAARTAFGGTFKPKLDMRPITTPINLHICGASGTGKTSFIRMCAQTLSAAAASPTTSGTENPTAVPSAAAEAAGIGPAEDPHAVLLSGSGAFCTTLPPIVCPEACRALVYTFQVGTLYCPQQHCSCQLACGMPDCASHRLDHTM